MATATKIVRLDAWVRRPSFATKARDVVRQVLVPGQTMSTKDIYRAALKVNATMPTVITRPTPAPPVKKVNMKSAYAEAPHPDHPIRSMTFLKHTVLPLLERAKDVEKVHQIRPLTEDEIERRLSSQPLSKAARKAKAAELADKKIEEWVWLPVTRARRAQLEQANNVAREKARQEEERKARKPFGWEVGVGTDYAHLSKRRQRSRQEKVKRNLGWMKELAQVRKESLAAAEAAQTAVPHVEQAPGSMGSA